MTNNTEDELSIDEYHTTIFTISVSVFPRYIVRVLLRRKVRVEVGSALIVIYEPTYAIKSNLLIRLPTF